MEQEIGERERSSNLSIIGTQPSDAGAYGCVAGNEPGTTAEQATLTVNGEVDSCSISMVCTLRGIPVSLTLSAEGYCTCLCLCVCLLPL